MNTQRILTWAGFIIVIGLIVWGMIAASQKADREAAGAAPVDDVTADDWARGGSASSTAVLIEYSDFQCPACAAYFKTIEGLAAENPGLFTIVYRHFPLPGHSNAIPAAQASEAAGMQGKFWEMYEKLFINQESWATSTAAKAVFVGYATELGLDIPKFTADYELKEIKDKITAGIVSGRKAGVDRTPTFYLNGKRINPDNNYESFKKLFAEATSTNP